VRKPIEGLVAGILTERQLAINIGSNDGVETGMRFRVMANTPTEITDPSSGEVLGTVYRDKVRVKVENVEPRFAICRTYRFYREPGNVWYYAFQSLSRAGTAVPPTNIPETLKAEDTDFLPDLPEEESFVKKGDRVVQIVEDDE
jgi:hypothetical protein